MKKINFLFVMMTLLFMGVVTGCKDDDEAPTIEFNEQNYVLMADKELTVSVTLSEPTDAQLSIPFTLGGTAVENTDYTISAKEFTVEPGKNTASVTITPNKNYEADRNITLKLGEVIGYDFGKIIEANIAVTPKEKIIYAFEKEYYPMAGKAEVYVKILNSKGKPITTSKDVTIPFEINSSSTAVNGIHYSVDADKFVIPAGESSAKVTFTYNKVENEEDDKNIVKLNFPDLGAGFIPGAIIETTVQLFGSTEANLTGKWKGEVMSNLDNIKGAYTAWYIEGEVTNLPENIKNNTLTISESKNGFTLKIEGDGDAAKYFKNTSFTFVRNETIHHQELGIGKDAKKEVYFFELQEANTSFTSSKETIGKSLVGFRVFEKEDNKILEATIFDFIPVDFLVPIYNMTKDWSTPPYKKFLEFPMNYTPIRYQFKLTNE